MPVRPVVLYPDPLLRQEAGHVTDFARAAALAGDLTDTMAAHPRCVGLAAPQIGVLQRMIAINVDGHPKADESHGLLVLANPRVVAADGSEVGREGCLSLPDITANVVRAVHIHVEARLPDGRPFTTDTSGFEARVLLHEIDHLDGILILDRVASEAEIFARRRR